MVKTSLNWSIIVAIVFLVASLSVRSAPTEKRQGQDNEDGMFASARQVSGPEMSGASWHASRDLDLFQDEPIDVRTEPEPQPQPESVSEPEPGAELQPEPETTPADDIFKTSTMDPGMYMDEEEEYQRMLATMKEELLESTFHPVNYVKDDQELEFLLSQLEENEEVIIETRLKRWEEGAPMVFELDICPICHDYMDLDKDAINLPCSTKHKFHEDCILKYFITLHWKDLTCPMCRTPINVDE